MRFLLFLVMAISATRCGVEAGNAGSGKGKTGSVKIIFAQESSSSKESLSVGINSLALVSSSDSTGTSITPSVDSVDLFSQDQSESVVVAESTIIPIGSYAQISIRLKGDKPIRYRDSDGRERDVNLGDSSSGSFYVSQTFTVTEGRTTSIVVNLDPYRSLESSNDDRFVFKPRGDARSEDEDVSYKGTTNISNARWVCAYAYAIDSNQQPQGGRPNNGGGRGPSDDHGPRVEDRGSSSSKSDVVKDTNDSCSKAFAKAPVIDGKFEFKHLIPASYTLRIFSSNGNYSDVADDIKLSPKDRH